MFFGINEDFGFSTFSQAERIRLIADAGFTSIFCRWPQPDGLALIANVCKDAGLQLQFVHMQYHAIRSFWHGSKEEAAAELKRQEECLQECAKYGVCLAVQHVFQGFEEPQPTEAGVYWFEKLLDTAQRLGIRIGFENTEGEAYLDCLRENLWNHPSFGFCWDSGHEACYNRGRNLLADYGERLLATHINDNFGVTGTEIDWRDDAHLLPYDGLIDWTKAAQRLARTGYSGILTLEMKNRNLPGRCTHDAYASLSPEEYLAKVRAAAERFSAELELARKQTDSF